jgi:invasion protein IalB
MYKLRLLYKRLPRYFDVKTMNIVLAFAVSMLGAGALYVTSLPKYPVKVDVYNKDTETYFSPSDENFGDVQNPEIAKNTEFEKFGDWKLECAAQFGNEEECHIFQRILRNDTKKEALEAHFLWIKKEGIPFPRLRLIIPLMSFIPPGAEVKLGENEAIYVPFQFCDARGCYVNIDPAKEVTEEMTKNEKLTVSYQLAEGGAVSAEISLDGFMQGLNALRELNLTTL